MNARIPQLRPAMLAYYTQLGGATSREAFIIRIARIITQNPYFFAPHLDMLDLLAESHDQYGQRAYLRFIGGRLRELVSNPVLLRATIGAWTSRDIEDILKIKQKMAHVLPWWSFDRLVCSIVFLAARRRGVVQFPYITSGKDLRKTGNIGVAEIKKEIEKIEPWWYVKSIRSRKVAETVDSIVIRVGPKTEKELYPSAAVSGLFPRTLAAVESFAKEQNGSVGEIILLRIPPKKRTFPCCEEMAEGTNRYHWIVSATRGTLSSGTESTSFEEGNVIYVNNRKMYSIENNSQTICFHVIFDLKQTNENIDAVSGL